MSKTKGHRLRCARINTLLALQLLVPTFLQGGSALGAKTMKCGACEKSLEGKQRVFCSTGCRNRVYTIKGFKRSEENRRKISLGKMGKKAPWMTKRNLENNPGKVGAESSQWRGEDVAYITLHSWIARIIVKVECERCKRKENLQYANKSGNYARDVADWFVLCAKCHYHYDRVEMAGKYRKFRNKVKQGPAC